MDMKRRSLTGGKGGKGKEKGVEGVVKAVGKPSGDKAETKIKVRFEGERKEDSLYVPSKYAKNMKPEHKYEFHLEDSVFRGGGGGGGRMSGSSILRRTKIEPTEVKDGGLRGGGGFRRLFSEGSLGSYDDPTSS